jgi:hypothetical protein
MADEQRDVIEILTADHRETVDIASHATPRPPGSAW